MCGVNTSFTFPGRQKSGVSKIRCLIAICQLPTAGNVVSLILLGWFGREVLHVLFCYFPSITNLPWWFTCSHDAIGSVLDCTFPVVDFDLIWLKPQSPWINSRRGITTWVFVDQHRWHIVVVDCDYLVIDVQLWVLVGPDDNKSLRFCLAVPLFCISERAASICEDLLFLSLCIYFWKSGCQANRACIHGDFCACHRMK